MHRYSLTGSTGSSPRVDPQASAGEQTAPKPPENSGDAGSKTSGESNDPVTPQSDERLPVAHPGSEEDMKDGGKAEQPAGSSSTEGPSARPQHPPGDAFEKTGEQTPSANRPGEDAGPSTEENRTPLAPPARSPSRQTEGPSAVPTAQRQSLQQQQQEQTTSSIPFPLLQSPSHAEIAGQSSGGAWSAGTSPPLSASSSSPLPLQQSERRGPQQGEVLSERENSLCPSGTGDSPALSRSPSTRLIPSPSLLCFQRGEQPINVPWNRLPQSPVQLLNSGCESSSQGYNVGQEGSEGAGPQQLTLPAVQDSAPSSFSFSAFPGMPPQQQQQKTFPGSPTIEIPPFPQHLQPQPRFAPSMFGPQPRMIISGPPLPSPVASSAQGMPESERSLSVCGPLQGWPVYYYPSQAFSPPECRNDIKTTLPPFFSQTSEAAAAQRGSGSGVLDTKNDYGVMMMLTGSPAGGGGSEGLSPSVSLSSLRGAPPPPPSPDVYWCEDLRESPPNPFHPSLATTSPGGGYLPPSNEFIPHPDSSTPNHHHPSSVSIHPSPPASYEQQQQQIANGRMASPVRLSPSDLFWSPEMVLPPDQGGYARCTLDPPTRIPLQNCRVSTGPPLSPRMCCHKRHLGMVYCPVSSYLDPKDEDDSSSHHSHPPNDDDDDDPTTSSKPTTPHHHLPPETSQESLKQDGKGCGCCSSRWGCERRGEECCCECLKKQTTRGRQRAEKKEAGLEDKDSSLQGERQKGSRREQERHSSDSPENGSSSEKEGEGEEGIPPRRESSRTHCEQPSSSHLEYSKEEGCLSRDEDERGNDALLSDSTERQERRRDFCLSSSSSSSDTIPEKSSCKNRRQPFPSEDHHRCSSSSFSPSICALCGCHNGERATPRSISAQEARSCEKRNLVSTRGKGDKNRSGRPTCPCEKDLNKKKKQTRRDECSPPPSPTGGVIPPRTVLTPGIASDWFFCSLNAIPLVRCHSPQEKFSPPKVGIGGYPIYPSEEELALRNAEMSVHEGLGEDFLDAGGRREEDDLMDPNITPRQNYHYRLRETKEGGKKSFSPPPSSRIDALAEGFDPLAFSSRAAAAAEMNQQHSLPHSRRESPRYHVGGGRKGASASSILTRSPRDHLATGGVSASGGGVSISTSRSSGSHHTSSWEGEGERSLYASQKTRAAAAAISSPSAPPPPVPYIPIRGSKIGEPRKTPLERETLSSLAARNRRLENQVS